MQPSLLPSVGWEMRRLAIAIESHEKRGEKRPRVKVTLRAKIIILPSNFTPAIIYSTLPDLAGGEEDSYSGFDLWVLRPHLASAMLILCRRHCHSAVRIRCS